MQTHTMFLTPHTPPAPYTCTPFFLHIQKHTHTHTETYTHLCLHIPPSLSTPAAVSLHTFVSPPQSLSHPQYPHPTFHTHRHQHTITHCLSFHTPISSHICTHLSSPPLLFSSVMSNSLPPHGLQYPGLLVHCLWEFVQAHVH